MLVTGALNGKISPNVWVMINSLQILRTILLLKIDIPLSVRQAVEDVTRYSIFDFGLYDFVIPEPGASANILKIMNGDELLAQYFKEYGIATYRFLDFTIATMVNVFFLFMVAVLATT